VSRHPVCLVRRAADGLSSLPAADLPAWSAAHAISWGDPPYTTWFRALWSDTALAIRFDASDVEPWWTMARRDDRLWEEEVVEIFLDPARRGNGYAELEISPGNVVCDLRVRRPWPQLHSDPAWHIDGLDTAVTPFRGPDAGPDGWTAIARLPWTGLQPIAPGIEMPPRPGQRWGFNVFRIKRPLGPEQPREDVRLLAWSPTGAPSFHVPAAFRDLVFE